jgi:hypothetical protein
MAVLAVLLLAGAAPVAAQDTTNTSVNPASRLGTKPVTVQLELRTDYPDQLPSPLYVPLRVRLLDPATGAPVPDAYHIKARVDTPGKASTEAYEFAYPYGDTDGALPGVYHGIVIVPAGGRWKVLVNAFNVRDDERNALPVSLGVAEIEVEATGPALESTLGNNDQTQAGSNQPSMKVSEVVLLYAHSGLGGLWFMMAAAVILVGLPSRRRLLSPAVNQWLDRNVRKFGAGLAWTTGLLWVSGIVNLQDMVAYDPPLSADQWNRLDILPYAKPYVTALYAKIAMYALLSLAALPLIREAKRRASEFDGVRRGEQREGVRVNGDTDGGAAVAPAPAPEPVPAGSVAATAGTTREAVATVSRPAARPARVRPPIPVPVPATRFSGSARLGILAVAAGGPVIILCVTILKYAHILSEQLRIIR